MKSKKKLYITVFSTVGAAAVFLAVYVQATITTALPFPNAVLSARAAGTSKAPATTADTASATVVPGPTVLAIPTLKIRADVTQVGKTLTGAMATPTSFSKVGWYKYGTVPGDKGSAVIAGHVDNGLALSGVFKHLKDIRKGDDIDVTLSTGKTIHFTVTDISTYDYKNAPAQEIFGQNDGRYLKLITCTGTLLRAEHTYDQRLVVTAVMSAS